MLMKPHDDFDDPLFRLERMIARRADELARQAGINRGNALEHWRQAEREILEREAPELTFPSLGDGGPARRR